MKGVWSSDQSGKTPGGSPAKQQQTRRTTATFTGVQPNQKRTEQEEKEEEQRVAKRRSETQSKNLFSPPPLKARSRTKPPRAGVQQQQSHTTAKKNIWRQQSDEPIIEEAPSIVEDPESPAPVSPRRIVEVSSSSSENPPDTTTSTSSMTAAPQQPTADAEEMEKTAVHAIAWSINNILARALTNVLDLMGSVAWKLGDNDVRHSLVYLPHGPKDRREDPLSYLRIIDENDPNLTTMKYFFSTYSPKLGMRFLQAYLKIWMESQKTETEKLLLQKISGASVKSQISFMGASHCFDFQEDLDRTYPFGEKVLKDEVRISQLENRISDLKKQSPQNENAEQVISTYARQLVHEKMVQETKDLLSLSEPELAFAPAWAFELVSSDVFRAFVAPARLAAVDLAHAQIIRIKGCESFTIKELICSKGVVDQFAWMIAYQYMDASKGLPMHRPKGEKGERGIYVNINHMRETVQKRAYLCTIWFESVRAFPNPILAQFDKYRDEQLQRQKHLQLIDDSKAKAAAWNASMDALKASLPKRELKYVGQ